MKNLRSILCASLLAWGGIIQGQYILTVNLTDLDAYIGHQFEIRVTESSTGAEVGRHTIEAVAEAAFSIDLYVLLDGQNYTVDFYADVNGNAAYDAPPTDHAWRRLVVNASQHTSLQFMPDDTYEDIGFPNPFPYSLYKAVWGGKWMNLTFGSTDTIEASMDLRCDSIFLALHTAGLFGNPAPVDFVYENAVGAAGESDTIRWTPDAPWTGEVIVVNGEMHGDISPLAGVSLQFTGTVGTKQIMALYTVIFMGNPFANGYFYIRELDIESSAPELELELTAVVDVNCFGEASGSIDIEIDGGTPVYVFLWSDNSPGEDLVDVPAGTYSITVTDQAGCTSTASFTVTEPDILAVEVNVINVSCAGLCDGSAFVSVSGGIPPYEYLWSTGSGAMQITGLCESEIPLTVTDQNGCTAVISAFVEEPDSLILDIIEIVNTTNGELNGAIDISITGGEGGFSFHWELNGEFYAATEDLLNIPAGSYCVMVSDLNGCTIKSEVFEVLDITGVDELTVRYEVYPNPAADHIRIEAESPLEIRISDPAGRVIASKKKSYYHLILTDQFAPGTYILELSDGEKSKRCRIIIQ